MSIGAALPSGSSQELTLHAYLAFENEQLLGNIIDIMYCFAYSLRLRRIEEKAGKTLATVASILSKIILERKTGIQELLSAAMLDGGYGSAIEVAGGMSLVAEKQLYEMRLSDGDVVEAMATISALFCCMRMSQQDYVLDSPEAKVMMSRAGSCVLNNPTFNVQK